MQRYTRFVLPTLALLSAVAFAADKLTVKELQAETKKFDGKEVAVTGNVESFKQKVSRAGNDYFTFKLVDKDDKKKLVNVFGHEKPKETLKDGQTLTVTGTFRLEKKVGDNTFKNEIQVQPEDIKILAQPK